MTALQEAEMELIALQEQGCPISEIEYVPGQSPGVLPWPPGALPWPPFLRIRTQLSAESLLEELPQNLWDRLEVQAVGPGELVVE